MTYSPTLYHSYRHILSLSLSLSLSLPGIQGWTLIELSAQVEMVSDFSSAIFQTKSYFGDSWSDLDHTDPCRKGYCFLYSKFQFVDYAGVKVEDGA